MAPKIFTTKVIVDIQVLASFFLIAFGAGNFFARNGARRIGNNVSLAVEDEEKLKDVLKRQEKISSQLEKLLSEKDQNNKTS
jgi:flagellar basal body-associated protein FliL